MDNDVENAFIPITCIFQVMTLRRCSHLVRRSFSSTYQKFHRQEEPPYLDVCVENNNAETIVTSLQYSIKLTLVQHVFLCEYPLLPHHPTTSAKPTPS